MITASCLHNSALSLYQSNDGIVQTYEGKQVARYLVQQTQKEASDEWLVSIREVMLGGQAIGSRVARKLLAKLIERTLVTRSCRAWQKGEKILVSRRKVWERLMHREIKRLKCSVVLCCVACRWVG